MQILEELALNITHITDLGAGQGGAAAIFLSALQKKGGGTLVCVDLKIYQELLNLFPRSEGGTLPLHPFPNCPGLQVRIIQEDTRTVELEETDLLLIDTTPSYSHLLEELTLHTPKCRRYLVIPGISAYGVVGHTRDDPTDPGADHDLGGPGELIQTEGLKLAIEQYFDAEPGWEVQHESQEGTGLLVMRRAES